MQSAANDVPLDEPRTAPPDWSIVAPWPGSSEIETHQPRNLLLLAAHQIVLRIGWIFKTESVIIPAFLDTVAGAGWLRGCLPVLNRFGQSLPPVFCAEALKCMRHKKHALSACVVLMSVPFGVLSAVCFAVGPARRAWLPWLFLALYGVFFVFNGLYHLSFGTVQGKLIRPTRRGRLLLVSTFYGSLPAMLFAWWLLGDWLQLPDGGFGYIFGFTAICFLLSGLLVLLLFEPADDLGRPSGTRPRGSLHDTRRTLLADRNLRRLVVVAMLFGSGLIVFPHYQAFARDKLELTGVHLMVWVITQNASVGIFSLFIGPLADAWCNRLTLRILVFGSAVAPLTAVSLSYVPGGLGAHLFWTIFIPLGMVPLVLRILANYALEICEPAEHPRYLSTVSLCLAAPFLLSPAVGWLVDILGFEMVFFAAAGLIALGGTLTFRLDEPRHRVTEGEPGPVGAGGEE